MEMLHEVIAVNNGRGVVWNGDVGSITEVQFKVFRQVVLIARDVGWYINGDYLLNHARHMEREMTVARADLDERCVSFQVALDQIGFAADFQCGYFRVVFPLELWVVWQSGKQLVIQFCLQHSTFGDGCCFQSRAQFLFEEIVLANLGFGA